MKSKFFLINEIELKKINFLPYNFLSLLKLTLYIVICFFLVSCGSLRLTYLGRIPGRNIIKPQEGIYIKVYNSDKKRLIAETDSLMLQIAKDKANKHYLNARDLNHLYSHFSQSLDIDRYYSSLLGRGKIYRDSLTEIQRYAAASLLASAAWYEKSFSSEPSVKRALNRGDRGYNIPRNILRKSSRLLFSPSVRKKLEKKDPGRMNSADSILSELPRTNFLKATFRPITQIPDRLNTLYFNFIQSAGKGLFSRGEEPEPVEPGDVEKAKKLLPLLQPYDIVLEKTSDYIKNQVIPGYFTHASLWLGIKNHLRFRYLAGLHSKAKGCTIHDKAMIEAITTGVRFSNLIECVHGKTYVILRYKPLTDVQKKSVMNIALRQLKKNYDFNFDIESADVINCTELIYLSFDFINWQTRQYLGTHTLFPDDLIKTALENNDIEIVAVMKDGIITEHPDANYIKALMKE